MTAISTIDSCQAKNRERLELLGLEQEIHKVYRGVEITNACRKTGGGRYREWRIKLSNIWFDSLDSLEAEVDRMQAEGDPIICAGRQEEPF